jgi:hypothetical protein
MTNTERDNLIAAIAEYRTDTTSPEALADYFYQGQVNSLDEKSDEDIEAIAEELGL